MNEVSEIIQAISELQESESLNKNELKATLGNVMKKFDLNNDGAVTQEEFINVIMSDSHLLSMLNFNSSHL